MNVQFSPQSSLSHRTLDDRVQTIENRLAEIAANQPSAQFSVSATPFSATLLSAYPVPPAEYVVYDHTDFPQNFYPTYNTVRLSLHLHTYF
jgi:hypothetical protein